MAIKLVLLLSILMISACAPIGQTAPLLTSTPDSSATNSPEVTAESSDRRVEAQLDGVNVSISVPPGWEARLTDEGIIMAEHFGSMDKWSKLDGLQAVLFVHGMDGFTLPTEDSANTAWTVLSQIKSNPRYIGAATVSEPQGFSWNDHDAAYYLLTGSDGTVTLLMALSLTKPLDRLFVINLSCPHEQSDSLRTMLARLLTSLVIDGTSMPLAVADILPDPLVFPVYEPVPGR